MLARTFTVALALASTLALNACAQPKTDEAFGQKVRAYLLEHPEVLVEVSAKLEEKQKIEAASKARA